MKMWMNYVMAKLNNKKGQGMVEYGLIIGLIAVGVIAILTAMGGHLETLFTAVKDALGTAASNVTP
jgi:pilus assembly protein Flp/PilA